MRTIDKPALKELKSWLEVLPIYDGFIGYSGSLSDKVEDVNELLDELQEKVSDLLDS